MSFRARFALIAGAWTVAVTGLVVAIPFWFRDRLPDPLAIHWGVSGSPDGSSSFAEFAVMPACVWVLLAVLALAPILRGRGVTRRRMRGGTGALLCAGAVFSAGLAALTAWANVDVADWRQARSLSWQVIVLLAIACGAGWLGWWVARLGPDEAGPDEPLDRRAEAGRLPLRRGGRLVWLASGVNRWLIVVSGIATTALALLLGLALLGSASTPWVFVAVTAVGAPTAFAMSAVRVRVGEQGVTLAFSPFRWPVRWIPLSKLDGARAETRSPSRVGGWGYRGLPGNATIMVRGGECLVLRYRSGSELGISVDDAERGAALINVLLDDVASPSSS